MYKMKALVFWSVSLCLWLSSSNSFELPACALLQQKSGPAPSNFGFSVAGVGDLDGDKIPDFIMGAPGSNSGNGSAFVYSGATGNLLFQKDGGRFGLYGDNFGYAVAGVGDVNGDGRDDFIVGAPHASQGARTQAGSTYVYSGQDGSLIYQIDGSNSFGVLGFSVSGAGDVNGDGIADFIIGAPNEAPTGSAYVFSGSTGDTLYAINGLSGGDYFGFSVDGIGDLNGDGKGDFIVGAGNFNAFPYPGYVQIFSGATGGVLYYLIGAAPADNFGYAVAGAGDINEDGMPDFIVGAPNFDPPELPPNSDAGAVYVYSGATGDLLYQKTGTSILDQLGSSVAGKIDINGDGRPDFITGAPLSSESGFQLGGSAFVYSGIDGLLLARKDASSSNTYLGISVAGVGDLNQDSLSEYIVGASQAAFGNGSAFIYTLSTDTIPPEITCPTDIIQTSDSALCGARITFSPIVSDNCAGVAYGSSLYSGSVFPLGTTPVRVIATDANNNKDSCTFTVTVNDIPPVAKCPPNVIVYRTPSQCGRVVNYTATVSDNCPGARIACIPGSVSFFPIGATVVTCIATDRNNMQDTCTFIVTVNSIRGDMNGDAALTPSDVMLTLNCVFLATGNCSLCFADVNCDGALTSSDVVLELNRVFLNTPFPCP